MNNVDEKNSVLWKTMLSKTKKKNFETEEKNYKKENEDEWESKERSYIEKPNWKLKIEKEENDKVIRGRRWKFGDSGFWLGSFMNIVGRKIKARKLKRKNNWKW